MRYFSMFVLLISFSFCTDESPRSTVPFAPVRFQIDLNGLDHTLKNPSSFKIFTEQDRRSQDDRFGYSGVFIVSHPTGGVPFAFDLCCPHEKIRTIKVVPNNDGFATCLSCGSVFETFYGFGTVKEGPSSEPLQRYSVYALPLQPEAFQVTN